MKATQQVNEEEIPEEITAAREVIQAAVGFV
jgi:hypothetical protein